MAIFEDSTHPGTNIEMTAIKKVQFRIIELLGFKSTIYTDLSEQILIVMSNLMEIVSLDPFISW